MFVFSLVLLLTGFVIAEFRRFYLIPIMVMVGLSLQNVFSVSKPIRKIAIILVASAVVVTVVNEDDNNLVSHAIDGLKEYNLGIVDESSRGDGLSVKLFSAPEPIKSVGKLLYALVTPLPIYYPMFEWNLIGLGTIFQVYFFGFVFLGCYIASKRFEFLELMFGFIILFYSYFNGTFTFRHITQWFPFAVLIGLVGYRRYYIYKNHIFYFITIILALLAFIYKILKSA
jgi:hypothetical protein